MPNYVEFEPKQPIALRLGEAENSPELDLLLQMLKLNPNQRISAQQVILCFLQMEMSSCFTFFFSFRL